MLRKMKFLPNLVLFLACCCARTDASPDRVAIAIVGGGVASASTAFYLRKLGLEGADIHV